jgi:hypothetical protein
MCEAGESECGHVRRDGEEVVVGVVLSSRVCGCTVPAPYH